MVAMPLAPLFWVLQPGLLSGLKLWTKADAGVNTSGGGVAKWDDQSGSGNHLVMNSANKRPALVNKAIGDKPAVRFDGKDDCLERAARGLMGERFSIYMVMKTGRPNTPQMLLDTAADGKRSRHPIWVGKETIALDGWTAGILHTDAHGQ